VSISAEFIVNLGPYEHVKISVSAESFGGLADQMDHLTKGEVAENFGDWHACLKAAVLYGRDQAFTGAKAPERELTILEQAEEQHRIATMHDDPEEGPETAHEGAVEALKEELGATVLTEEEKPSEVPSSPSAVDAKPKRPWDKKPAKKAVAPKPQPKTESTSDWDF